MAPILGFSISHQVAHGQMMWLIFIVIGFANCIYIWVAEPGAGAKTINDSEEAVSEVDHEDHSV